jgi:hypothetical protein
VPEVEAPEGSGFVVGAFGAEICLGRVPEVDGVGDECVDGVGDECELLAVVELFEFVPVEVLEVGMVAVGTAGGAVLMSVLVGPNGCNLGTVVQLYWNSGTVSSSPVRNL